MPVIHVLLAGKRLGSFPMKVTPSVVGRQAGCEVHIDNAGVSRRHCEFTYEDGIYFVADAGSSNGTFLKGQKTVKAEVQNGAEVNIGKYVLIFEDTGLDFAPVQKGGAKPVPAGGFGGAQMTFQVDPATLRAQMEKAGVAASRETAAVTKKADEIAKAFDHSAPLKIKGKESRTDYLGMVIKLGGLAIIAAVVALAAYLVLL